MFNILSRDPFLYENLFLAIFHEFSLGLLWRIYYIYLAEILLAVY